MGRKVILRRVSDASEFNTLVNHPSIYPWVNGNIVGPIELSNIIANPHNVFLIGEYGGFSFISLQPAIYDIHAQCLPEGRGEWMREAANEAAWFLFTRTDALEIVARVPVGINRRVRALAVVSGMKRQFSVDNGLVVNHSIFPADIYAIAIQDWIANDAYVGKMAERLIERVAISHISDGVELSDACARHIAVVLEMIRNGQIGKAVVFHNRFAALAGLPPLNVISQSPTAVELCGIVFVIREDGYFVASLGARAERRMAS